MLTFLDATAAWNCDLRGILNHRWWIRNLNNVKSSLDLYVLHCKMCYIVKCSLVWKSISYNFIEKRSGTNFMFLVYSAKRNGTALYIALVHCNVFSNYVFLHRSPFRSAPRDNDGYTSILSQFQRSGAECFWQWWEHCNFSSHSIFPLSAPLRSAPLRTRIIATFPVPTERSGMLLTVMGTLQQFL